MEVEADEEADLLAPVPDEAARQAACTLIAERWREYQLAQRIRAMQRVNQQREERRQVVAAERAAKLEHEACERYFPGAMHKVWPVVCEVTMVMMVAVAIGTAAPEAFAGLPAPFAVRPRDAVPAQAVAAALGAGLAVAAFAVLFLAMVLFYVHRCTLLLHTVHALWVGGLIGGPLLVLLCRLCEAAGVALDGPTLVLVTWNLTAPGVLVVHWSATAVRFEGLRRGYAAMLSVGVAWILASVPYQTSLTALLMLALLDVLLVSFPGSPVQALDAIATKRREAGEAQMPGLVFKQGGVELGLGDFIIYSAFAVKAARSGVAQLAVVSVGVLAGLTVTMAHVALARRRTVVPALPLSIALGASLLVVERFMLRPLVDVLVDGGERCRLSL